MGNLAVTSPSAVPKVSLAAGLVFKQLTGIGWLFNNHHGSISISPDGNAYVGMMGGMVRLRDG